MHGKTGVKITLARLLAILASTSRDHKNTQVSTCSDHIENNRSSNENIDTYKVESRPIQWL